MIILEYQKNSNRIYSEFEGHCHSEYEIFYFISGDAELMVEGKIYKLTPHSLFILPPNTMHGIQVNSRMDYIRHVLFMTPQDIIPERMYLLTGLIPDRRKAPGQEIFFEHIERFHMEQFFHHLKLLHTQPEDFQAKIEPIYTEALLAQLNLICRTLKPAIVVNRTPEKIIEVINYLNLHLTEPHTLDSIASHFFISKNYLNKSFNQYLGKTVIEYIRHKRIILAKQYIHAGESAMNAALQAGFSDYSSFYRAYVKYEGASPRRDMTEA